VYYYAGAPSYSEALNPAPAVKNRSATYPRNGEGAAQDKLGSVAGVVGADSGRMTRLEQRGASVTAAAAVMLVAALLIWILV
jgi:hypothetical protein